MNVGQLLTSGNNIYRIISMNENSLTVIEYTNTENIIFISQINGKYYKWVNGLGVKLSLTPGISIHPDKKPQKIYSFLSLLTHDMFIIKGVLYNKVELNSLTIPTKWISDGTVVHLRGKKDALLMIVNLKRKTFMDKSSECEFMLDGTITTLKESDVWIFTL
jgi:hypothetical protein